MNASKRSPRNTAAMRAGARANTVSGSITIDDVAPLLLGREIKSEGTAP